jgi:hypothetical protein
MQYHPVIPTITINYYSFPRDKSRHNNIFVVIDRLSKQAISIPCYKTTIAKDIARLYIYYIYIDITEPPSLLSQTIADNLSPFSGNNSTVS